MLKSEIKEIFRSHSEELLGMGLLSIGIFGSVVRNEQNKDSDIDILAEFRDENRNLDSISLLCDFIERYIGNKYDLVTKGGLSPHIGPDILKEVEYVDLHS